MSTNPINPEQINITGPVLTDAAIEALATLLVDTVMRGEQGA